MASGSVKSIRSGREHAAALKSAGGSLVVVDFSACVCETAARTSSPRGLLIVELLLSLDPPGQNELASCNNICSRRFEIVYLSSSFSHSLACRTWCGPCKALKPQLAALAAETRDVFFYECLESDAPDLIASESVRAFPTLKLYLLSRVVDEITGANLPALRAAIEKHRPPPGASAFSGAGQAAGGGSGSSANQSAQDVRAARLRALGGGGGGGSGGGVAAPTPPVMSAAAAAKVAALARGEVVDEEGERDAIARAALAKARAGGGGNGGSSAAAAAAAAFVPKPELLSLLVEFGFTRNISYRALQATGNVSVEAATDWLEKHQDDAGVNAPIAGFSDGISAASPVEAPAAAAAAPTSSSLSSTMDVDDTTSGGGAVAPATAAAAALSDADAAAVLAAEEAIDSASAAGAPKKKMTPEEVVAFLAKRRADKAAAEKEDARVREIKRRSEGQATQEMADEIAALQRKREVEKMKHDKEVTAAESRRLKVELARDKMERWQKLHPGVPVPSEMMDALQVLMGTKEAAPAAAGAASAGAATAAAAASPAEALENAIRAIAAYKAGVGATCAATARALCANALASPGEAKYRTVNLANEKVRERLSSVRGGLALMTCAGWQRDTVANTLTIAGDAYDATKLAVAVAAIDKAVAEGRFV